MTTDHTVHPNAVAQLRAGLDALGLESAAILARVGLPLDPQPDAPRLARAALLAAKAEASRVARDPWLGYRLGAHTRLENFAVFGAALQHAANLTDALRVGIAHLAIWEEGTQVDVVPVGDGRVHVRYRSLTPTTALAERIDGQQSIVFMLGIARSWFGAHARLAAGFACAPPRRPHAVPASTECRFREPWWYVEIPTPGEAAPARAPRPALAAMLQRALSEEVARVRRAPDLRARLREHLRARLSEAPSLVSVSAALGQSPRSLQGKLHGLGTTFAEELASVRVEVARALLADPEAGVKQVAHAVGFSQTAPFTRFMRRETGRPPSWFLGERADE